MCHSIFKWIELHPQWVAVFVYSIIEHALGKTKKLESNSLIALIINFVLRRKL